MMYIYVHSKGCQIQRDTSKYTQDVPNSGMFMSNCAHHISLVNPTTWAEMAVPTIDSSNQAAITLNQVHVEIEIVTC